MDNTRQMERENRIIAEEIKKEMARLESAPPTYAWERISTQVFLADNSSKKKIEPVPWYRSLGFAAAVLFLVGIGSSVFLSGVLDLDDSVSSTFRAVDMLNFDEEMSAESQKFEMSSDDVAMSEDSGITKDTSGAAGAAADDEIFALGDDVMPGAESVPERPPISSGTSGIPDSLGGFLLRDVKKSVGAGSTDFYLYTESDREIWLVVSEFNPRTLGDFAGLEGRYIPEDILTHIDENSTRALVRDNMGNHVIVWLYGNEYYLLWARNDKIARRDLIELRSYWPNQ